MQRGCPVGIVAVYVDVSGRIHAEVALRQSQEQLRQAQKMEAVGRLAGGVAHDFNNLLTAILGYSELVAATTSAGRPAAGEDVEQIRRRGEPRRRAHAAAARLQPAADARSPKVIDLNAVVGQRRAHAARLIGEDIELRTRALPPSLGRVQGRPGQIEQVIINLVVNARDAMPDGGMLTIATANAERRRAPRGAHGHGAARRYVMLAVRDTGIGHDARDAGAHLRAVLHHQGAGQGHRPGPLDGLRHRGPERRPGLA